jgi:Photosynthesis system II assembly factor YCF48
MRLIATIAALAIPLVAQDQPPAAPQPPPELVNTGKPITVPFHCTDEDVRLAGLTCTEDDPCPVYLELSSMESTGIRILAAGNLHTADATLFSIILGSEDNGHTWREVHERIRAASFDRIEFRDAENGWVSGLSLSPLPQDPFLLHTTDGGKTWRAVPIFSETRYGSIQQFYFGDKSNGALIIDHGAGSGSDRYERYESQDGGDSWGIKETSSKPLVLKSAAAAAAPEWRVRADASSKSFQLEHRQGQRWAGVASFAVSAGVCKPQD